MNKRPNSNLSGRLVPIFANNKKKRLKQALYANPSTDDFSNSSTVTSTDAYNESSNSGNEYFETGPQKQSLPPPQRMNSLGNEGYYNESFSSMRGGIANSSIRRGSHTGNNRGVQNRMPVKQEPQLPPPRANTMIKNNGPRAPQYQAGRGAIMRNSKIKTEQQDNTSKNRPVSTSTNLPMSSENFQRDQNQTSKERSTKQVNLMVTPADKTLKVITATIQNVLEWKQFEDKMAVIYEIFGTLDSQVSLNSAGNAKNFVIKDKTRNLSKTKYLHNFCMGIYNGELQDCQLPRLTRGQMHRCMGSLDRKNGNFNCVSIRPVRQAELQAMTVFLEASQLAMQEQLTTLKED